MPPEQRAAPTVEIVEGNLIVEPALELLEDGEQAAGATAATARDRRELEVDVEVGCARNDVFQLVDNVRQIEEREIELDVAAVGTSVSISLGGLPMKWVQNSGQYVLASATTK
jgi:hypothetical protein